MTGGEDVPETTTEARVGGLDDGFRMGREVGRHEAFGDGITRGYQHGEAVGAARALAAMEGVLGREVIDAVTRQAAARLPNLAEHNSYRKRTTYEQPAGRPEWRGLDNGDSLDRIAASWETQPARRAAADDGTEAGR